MTLQTDVSCSNICGTLKNPHNSMIMDAKDMSRNSPKNPEISLTMINIKYQTSFQSKREENGASFNSHIQVNALEWVTGINKMP